VKHSCFLVEQLSKILFKFLNKGSIQIYIYEFSMCILEMQQYLHLIDNKLCPDTSKIVVSYAWTLDDVYFLTGEWIKIECVADYAAKNGLLDLIKWTREHHFPLDSGTCSIAATNGHFEFLKWTRGNCFHWNKFTCSGAAKDGHLEILKWARENECLWDTHTCSSAAKGGHLEVLK
jgi:hypothetical protein